MKGGPRAAQLSGEMMAVLPFTLGVEKRYLEGFTMYGAAPGPTGGVGQTAGIRLRNPINSNVLVIVQLLILFGANGDVIRSEIGILNTDLTAVITGFRMDARGNQNSVAQLSNTANATFAGNALHNIVLATNTDISLIVTEAQEIPLLPGDSLTFVGTTVAQQIVLNIQWRGSFFGEVGGTLVGPLLHSFLVFCPLAALCVTLRVLWCLHPRLRRPTPINPFN